MSVLRGKCVRILLMTSAASFAFNGVAAAQSLGGADEGDPFASLETLSVDELMDARGGYSAGGFKFNIGVQVTPVQVTPVKPLPAGGALGGKGALPDGGALGGKGALPDGGALGGNGALPDGGALGGNGALPDGGALGGQGALPNGGALGGNGALGNNNAGSTNTNAAPTVNNATQTTTSSVAAATTANTATNTPPAPVLTNDPAPTTTASAPVMEPAPTTPSAPVNEPAPVTVVETPTTPAPTSSAPEPQSYEQVGSSQPTANTGGTIPQTPVVNATPVVEPGASAPAVEPGATTPVMTTYLSLDVLDVSNRVRDGARASAVDDNSNHSRPAPSHPGVTPGDPATTIAPAGETIIQQEGYSVSLDNTRDNIQVNLTTDYTVQFENYRQGIEMAIGTRVTQMAIGTQAFLGGLSN